MKREPPQLLEIEIPSQVIMILCEEGHFLADCRDKQDILSEGSSYYLCQSENKNLWSLVQKINGKSITWGSKYFDVHDETSIIDLWISLKKPYTTSPVLLTTSSQERPSMPVKQKKFMTLGMNEGWGCGAINTACICSCSFFYFSLKKLILNFVSGILHLW